MNTVDLDSNFEIMKEKKSTLMVYKACFQSVASSVTFDTVSSSLSLSGLVTSTADSDSLAAISDTLSDFMPNWISLITCV